MKKWVSIQVDLELAGRITQLPDSQKIFGALAYLYSEYSSSELTSKFVRKIKDGEIYFALSNLLPHGFLPVPHSYLLDMLGENKAIYKKIKKRNYTQLENIQRLMEDPSCATIIYPYVTVSLTQQIHAAIDSKRYNLPGLDPNLYSVPEIEVKKISEDGKIEHVKHYSFLLVIEEGEESARLQYALEEANKRQRKIVLGARGSQGLNTYHVVKIETQLEEESRITIGMYLNLGMLIPKQINFELSSIKLFTSERRPYNPIGGWDKDSMVGHFISYIEQGSIVYTQQGLKNAGKSIESPYNETKDIVFGNALLYFLSERGKEIGEIKATQL